MIKNCEYYVMKKKKKSQGIGSLGVNITLSLVYFNIGCLAAVIGAVKKANLSYLVDKTFQSLKIYGNPEEKQIQEIVLDVVSDTLKLSKLGINYFLGQDGKLKEKSSDVVMVDVKNFNSIQKHSLCTKLVKLYDEGYGVGVYNKRNFFTLDPRDGNGWQIEEALEHLKGIEGNFMLKKLPIDLNLVGDYWVK